MSHLDGNFEAVVGLGFALSQQVVAGAVEVIDPTIEGLVVVLSPRRAQPGARLLRTHPLPAGACTEDHGRWSVYLQILFHH